MHQSSFIVVTVSRLELDGQSIAIILIAYLHVLFTTNWGKVYRRMYLSDPLHDATKRSTVRVNAT